jgi:hypothetical protein
MSAAPTAAGKKNWITWALLGAWALGLIVVIVSLSARHSAALPKPGNEALLARALLPYRRHAPENFLDHVIYAQCSCSRSLLNHLF